MVKKQQEIENRYPPHEPYEPVKPERSHYNLTGADYDDEDSVIYHDVVLLNEDYDLEEDFAEQEKEVPNPPKGIQGLTLQDVVDLAPPGAKLSDIIFHLDYPRYLDYLEFTFSYVKRDEQEEERVFQEAVKKYEKDYAKYQQELAVYQKELADYNEWKREKHIRELEEQLVKLKK